MKYIIIGGGPTGLSLAWILANNGIEVTVIEKSDILGGSWKNQWIDNLYFSENSPRVLTGFGYCRRFLKDIGMQDTDFSNIYGNIWESNMKIFTFIKRFFNVNDYLILSFAAIIGHKFYRNNVVLQQWLDNSYLSENAKYALRIICITICDTPINTNIHDFFGSFGFVTLQQMKDSNKWHILWKQKMEKMPHVQIITNTEALSFGCEQDSIHSVYCKTSCGNTITFCGDRFIIATQSNSLCNILTSSTSKILENNWFTKDTLLRWCSDTHYNGFGFQLHFKEKVPMPNEWCWSCLTDWCIITLPISDWVEEFSKDPYVKMVWSCCIIDLETLSNYSGKSANMCSKTEVIHEAIRQLKTVHSFPWPYHITTSRGLHKKNGTWHSEMTGFTRKQYDYLPMKGKVKNLFALGCFTEPKYNTIAYIETAIQASVQFIQIYHPTFFGFHNDHISSFTEKTVTAMIIFVILYLHKKKAFDYIIK